MQKGTPGKKKPKIVVKPMLAGQALDAMSLKRALRVTGGVLISLFFYVVFGFMLTFENLLLRILVNAVLLFMGAGLLYMTGATHGEADAAFGEIMYQREAEGKSVPQSERARSFLPAKGIVTALLGALPFVLLALVVTFTAQLQTYSLGALPEWLSTYRRQPEIGDALRYYETTVAFGVLDVIKLIVRFVILPFIGIVGSTNASAVLLVERLSPLLALFVPAGYALGYLRGKELRARVHTSIALSRRRKKNKEKKERQRRQQKGPEQLV